MSDTFVACFMGALMAFVVPKALAKTYDVLLSRWMFRKMGASVITNYVQPKMCTCKTCGSTHGEWPKTCRCSECGGRHIHGSPVPSPIGLGLDDPP